MALRAGYYGVKRRIWDALQNTAEKLVQDVSDIWANNNITGVGNFLLPFVTASKNSVNLVAADGAVTLSGASSSFSTSFDTSFTLPKGKYILSGIPSGYGTNKMLFVLVNRSTGADVEIGRDTGSGLTFELTKDSPVKLYLYTYQSYGTYDVTIYPQIVSVLNPDKTFTQGAMTNQQLTASASDQKTAINAIISAATGAADFAAFKTAMSAIAPVTRSAAPDERSLDVEVEEPVVVKKTTRKTTKKTEEEE